MPCESTEIALIRIESLKVDPAFNETKSTSGRHTNVRVVSEDTSNRGKSLVTLICELTNYVIRSYIAVLVSSASHKIANTSGTSGPLGSPHLLQCACGEPYDD